MKYKDELFTIVSIGVILILLFSMIVEDALLIKNDFSLNTISNLMEHATEIISVNVYVDNEEIIFNCLDELKLFLDKLKPDEEKLANF